MRTTPKYFLILAVTAGAALTAYGCASDEPSTAPNAAAETRVVQTKLQDVHAKYDWIGKYHTDGLAYVYSQLAKGNGKPRTRAEICRVAVKATKDFHKAQGRGEVPTGLMDPSLVSGVCPDETGKTSKTILVSGATRKTELSAGGVSLIDQITTLTNTATSRTELINGVLNIESQAAYLPPEEAGAVIAVGSIAISSVDYWEANLSAWVAIPVVKATAYSLSPLEMTAATVVSTAAPIVGPRYGAGWWQSPTVRQLRTVLSADAIAGARSIYSSWLLGPVGWDAAAAAALVSSVITALSLLF
jgi:hypothetical protein